MWVTSSDTALRFLNKVRKRIQKESGPPHKRVLIFFSLKNNSFGPHQYFDEHLQCDKEMLTLGISKNAIELREIRTDISKVLMERLKKKQKGKKKEVFQKMIFH